MGVAGVAGGWGGNGCKMLGIRCAYKDPGRLSSIIQGIAYSAINGAKVISMSYGIWGIDPTELQNAVNDAYANGLVLVASSGNGHLQVAYPGACDNVIAVGATIQEDTIWYGSNYGEKLDVVAPGGDNPPLGFDGGNIYTTTLRSAGSYAYFSGTSASCPHVAGLAALLFSANTSLTNWEVDSIIRWTADTVDFLRYPYGPDHWNEYYGFGRINAYRAVLVATEQHVSGAITTNTNWTTCFRRNYDQY